MICRYWVSHLTSSLAFVSGRSTHLSQKISSSRHSQKNRFWTQKILTPNTFSQNHVRIYPLSLARHLRACPTLYSAKRTLLSAKQTLLSAKRTLQTKDGALPPRKRTAIGHKAPGDGARGDGAPGDLASASSTSPLRSLVAFFDHYPGECVHGDFAFDNLDRCCDFACVLSLF